MLSSDSAPATEPNVWSRTIGVVVSPKATLTAALASPKPMGILLLVAVVMGLATGGPQLTDRGRQAALDMQVDMFERFSGQRVTPEMYARMETQSAYSGYLTIVQTFVGAPIMALFFSGLLWGIFNAALGGTAAFKSVLTVVAHGMVIMALGALLAAPVQLMQGVMSVTGPFTLAGLVPMLDESSFVVRFLAWMNVFTLWQTLVVAMGLGVLYGRRTQPIAIGLLCAYVGLVAIGLTVVSTFTTGR